MVITGLRLAANSFWVARAVSPEFAGGSRKRGAKRGRYAALRLGGSQPRRVDSRCYSEIMIWRFGDSAI